MTSAFPVSSLFSVPPYVNNYFNVNASTHSVTTRRCNDIHILKENLEIAKRLFYFTGGSEFNSLPIFIRSKKSFLDFSRETKDLFLN